LKTLTSSTLALHIRQLPSSTAYLDTNFDIVLASDRWHELFGTNPRQKRKSFIDVLELRDSIWHDTALKCLKDPAERGLRFFVPKLSDSEIDFTFLPYYGDNEEVQGLVVEARKVMPDPVKENAMEVFHQYEELSNIARIGYWEYFPNSGEINWSPMTRRIHGVSNNFIPTLQTALGFYKKGHSRNRIEEVLDQALEFNRPYSERLQIVTSSGKELWIRATGKCEIQLDGVKKLSGTFQDIDDIVRIEEARKSQQKLLQTLIDNIPLNVYIKDTESRKILVNKAECEYSQIADPAEVIGKSDFDLFSHEVAKISREEDIGVMETGNPILNKETFHTIDKKTTSFLTSKVPYYDAQGQVMGIIGMSMDISKRKEQEKELENLLELTSKQNNRLMDFAHIVAHNLQSNASNIQMLLDFQRNEAESDRKQQLSQMLVQASDNLIESLENINELVNSSLKKPLGKKRLNLQLEVNKCLANLSAQINYHDIRLQLDIDDNADVLMTPAYLDSILLNVLSNAIKYRKTSEASEITIRTIPNKEFTLLLVEDNGKGINMKRFGDKMFGLYKTFHQMEHSRGIGLYITKNQLENSGGQIRVCSEEGIGSSFALYFPRP